MGWGLLLSLLTGPIFFTIVQVSIERGVRAGTFLVAGQWMSDYIYIGLAFFGAGYMQALENNPIFKEQLSEWLGSFGAIFLSILGLVLLLTKPKNNIDLNGSISKSYGAFFLQGFLINSLTPFPVFFWISLMSAAIGRRLDNLTTLGLFIGVMLMVMLTDLLKVYTAGKISKILNAKNVILVRKIAGLALILSGLFMFVRIFILK